VTSDVIVCIPYAQAVCSEPIHACSAEYQTILNEIVQIQ
jgi:hypothetical protein